MLELPTPLDRGDSVMAVAAPMPHLLWPNCGRPVRARCRDAVRAGAQGWPLAVNLRSRRLLSTTLTLLSAMAAEAMAGFSRQPSTG